MEGMEDGLGGGATAGHGGVRMAPMRASNPCVKESDVTAGHARRVRGVIGACMAATMKAGAP